MKKSLFRAFVYSERGFFIYKCPICGNEDPKYLGLINGQPYCRRCITFFGEPADDLIYIRKYKGSYTLKYELSPEQKEISNKTIQNFMNHEDTLIYAVCGAGKTELVFGVIDYALKNNYKIGFAIPRRDVVIELANRLQNTFSKYKVVSVYGGHTDSLVGDIICLTTHQLYRYESYFDLLILDEIDAFPFKGDFVLNAFFKRSVRGNYVMMSATPTEEMIDYYRKTKGKNLIELYTRYHKKPIPVPIVCKTFNSLMAYKTLKYLEKFVKENKPVLIFTPTISECEILFKMLKIFVKCGNFVHSKRQNRSLIIDDFKESKYKYLVTTAVLERGVTIKNLQVIIYNAGNDIYTKEGLIQISGRVGRVIGATEGEVIYITTKETEAIKKSIKEIEFSNSHL